MYAQYVVIHHQAGTADRQHKESWQTQKDDFSLWTLDWCGMVRKGLFSVERPEGGGAGGRALVQASDQLGRSLTLGGGTWTMLRAGGAQRTAGRGGGIITCEDGHCTEDGAWLTDPLLRNTWTKRKCSRKDCGKKTMIEEESVIVGGRNQMRIMVMNGEAMSCRALWVWVMLGEGEQRTQLRELLQSLSDYCLRPWIPRPRRLCYYTRLHKNNKTYLQNLVEGRCMCQGRKHKIWVQMWNRGRILDLYFSCFLLHF